MTNSVNQDSPLYMSLTFTDEDGDPLIPTTVEWRLDDREDDSEIVDWTSLSSPAASMSMVIPGSNNSIVDETKNRERRTYGIRVDNTLAGEGYEEFHYHVVNIFGV